MPMAWRVLADEPTAAGLGSALAWLADESNSAISRTVAIGGH